jgi:hypothetical protein
MAGTVVTTEEVLGDIQKVKWVWTSSAGGAADDTTDKAFSGIVERVIIIPGTAGDAPDDLFDVAITDGDSVDITLGNGANCSNANTTVIMSDKLSAVDNDTLTLAVTNAGAAKKGTVIVYVR